MIHLIFAKKRNYRRVGLLLGILLGVLSLYGMLLIKVMLYRQQSVVSLSQEISAHSEFYNYLAFTTPIAFGAFGFYMGLLIDRIRDQRNQLQQMNVMLANQSISDDLTGLLNHRHILVQIDKEVERSKRYGRKLSGMMIDIDDFKSINDCYGHLTGDSVIRELAELINRSVRNVDIVGRFGGDEFLVILPEADADAARLVSERVLETIRKHPFKTGRDYLQLTVSIGVFSVEDPKDFDRSSFIDRMDRAMFYAKEQGKNRVHHSGGSAP